VTALASEDRTTRRARGHRVEFQVARELARRGANIVEMNFRAQRGEIDIVIEEGGAISFVEVRSLQAGSPVDPAETVGPDKRRRIALSAQEYLERRAVPRTTPVRFDVVAAVTAGDELATVLEIRWIKGAFTLEDVPGWQPDVGRRSPLSTSAASPPGGS